MSAPGVSRRPLGVVIPTYNEGQWVERAVSALVVSAEEAGWELDVVVIDDGSDDADSCRVLEEIGSREHIRVLHQPNGGRFAARATGLRTLTTDDVLLLDSRVEIDRFALTRLAQAVTGPDTEVWNFDVTPGSSDPRALFWTGITKLWWRDYFIDRRHVSFGPEDFDRYPKGTGAFFGPRRLLVDALGTFSSLFEDHALASDDTRLLREVVRSRPINITPEITCRHFAKAGWRPWLRQCYYRGTTFVDGYLKQPERAQPLLLGGLLLTGAGVALATLAPRVAAAATLSGSAAAGGVVHRCGGTNPEAASVVLLTPAFGVFFGAGVLRGLWYAGRRR